MKALRLLALQDPMAHVAYLETYDEASAKPDSCWQERAARSAEGADDTHQFVAEGPDGEWVGTATLLVQEAGTTDWAGYPVDRRQGYIAGVYMQPEHRGCGLTEVLFVEALEWAWAIGLEQVRLIVHENNGRAMAFYRKAGFVPSGVCVPLPGRGGELELEMVIERP